MEPGCVEENLKPQGGQRPRIMGKSGSLLGEEIYPTPPTSLGHLCQSEQN